MLHLSQYRSGRDALHAVFAVLRRHGIVLTWFSIFVDHQVVESPVRTNAFGIPVSIQADGGSIQRDGDMHRARIDRQHQRGGVEDGT